MKWILCSERLPEENGVYLVTVQNVEEGWAFVISAWFSTEIPLVYGRKGWTPLNEFYDLANQIRPDIVAWMPLPEPYREKEADCKDEPNNCPYYSCAVWDEMAFTREKNK